MHPKLKERIATYEDNANQKLLPKLPVIITVNGRSFFKATSLLDKPFSTQFAECLCATLIKLMQEIDGTVFGYAFNDEVVVVSRNDQSHETMPWYGNNLQKMVSAAASIATLQFSDSAAAYDLNLFGDPIFLANIFLVPNISEAINVVLAKQQNAISLAIQFACFYELLKKYQKEEIKEILAGTTNDEKVSILRQECQIDFYQHYPLAFQRGVASYRTPTILKHGEEEIVKDKLILNAELPIFVKEHNFLGNIFRSGRDIFRLNNSI